MWRADETDLISDPPIKPGGILITEPELSESWWSTLNASLTALAKHPTTRIATSAGRRITQARITATIHQVFPEVDTRSGRPLMPIWPGPTSQPPPATSWTGRIGAWRRAASMSRRSAASPWPSQGSPSGSTRSAGPAWTAAAGRAGPAVSVRQADCCWRSVRAAPGASHGTGDREQSCQGGTISRAYTLQKIAVGDEFLVVISHPDSIASEPYAGVDIAKEQSCAS